MTLVVWGACDDFALVMADRRAFNGRVVPDPDGMGSAFGEMVQGSDTTKALTSNDSRDIFAIAGTSVALVMARAVVGLHGGEADAAIFSATHPRNPLDWALDPTLLPAANTILHAYSHAGKVICCRLQWSPTMIMRELFVGSSARIALAVAGSGGPHVQGLVGADPEQWDGLWEQVQDWRPLRKALDGIFDAVSRIDTGVGPNADAWIFTKSDGVWVKLDRADDGNV